ncbi:MAG: beta-lactamase family protein [Chloroflexi bacterium]|nr:beta-lactamase family protein [Chloroflexota bacterium]
MTTGLSADRLGRIDRFLTENYIDAGKIPGALTLVARRGEIAHFSALGLMDSERGKPTQKDTIYRIYSMTKPITTVALMMLYEEGRFQLNDPVGEFLPEWSDTEVWVSGEHPDFKTRPPDRAMTIRDLLSHQSGLTYGFTDDNPVDRAYPNLIDRPLAEWSTTLAGLPLLYSPGTAWNYSVSTDLCGYLVEVISGQKFDAFLKERILGPLGMVDTAFYVPDDRLDRFAACYAPTAENGFVLQDDPETSAYRKTPKLLSGGGGMVSTASDYFRLCQMLLNGGELEGQRILSRKTIDLMTTNHLPGGKSLADRAIPGRWSEATFDGIGFGLGFSVVLEPSTSQIVGSPGQYAWGGAASTAFWIDPVEEVIVVFMTQLIPSNDYPLRRELQVLVNAAIDD